MCFSAALPASSCGRLTVPSAAAQRRRRALASRWCSAPETCSLWCPLQPSQILREGRQSLSLLLLPCAGGGCAGARAGAARLRTVVPGLGVGAPPPSPARPPGGARLPPRPEPSPASAVQAPHCRCPPAAERPAAPAVPAEPLQPRAPAALPLLRRDPRPSRLAEPRAQLLRPPGGGDPGGRGRAGAWGSRMRQDKLTGSLRRGGRCLKRQGGGGGGGVGTILSNVLKKRSCISRTAPRLLCTLEPGEDWAAGGGAGKSRATPGAGCSRLCLRWTRARPGSTRRPPRAGHRGLAHAGLGRRGRAGRRPGPGRGQRPPKAWRTGRCRPLPADPHPAAWRGPALLVPELLLASCALGLLRVVGKCWRCPGHQRPRHRLCSGLARSQTLREVCEAGKGTGFCSGSEGKAAVLKRKSSAFP